MNDRLNDWANIGLTEADRANFWLSAQLWINRSSTSTQTSGASSRRPFPGTEARKLKKHVAPEISESEPLPAGSQGALAFAEWVADDMDAIMRVPLYTIGRKGQKAEIWRNLRWSRKRVFIDPSFDTEYMETPFRLGSRSYVCIGKDEQSRRIFRLDDLEAKQVTYVGFYPITVCMDQSKMIGFVGLDSIALWHPNGSRTVLLDGETSENLYIEGIVEIQALFRNPHSSAERILLLQQTWRYSSELPKSGTQVHLWKSGASHPIQVQLPPEIPQTVLTSAKSGILFEADRDTPIIAFPSSKDSKTRFIGMDFAGNIYSISETEEPWVYYQDSSSITTTI